MTTLPSWLYEKSKSRQITVLYDPDFSVSHLPAIPAVPDMHYAPSEPEEAAPVCAGCRAVLIRYFSRIIRYIDNPLYKNIKPVVFSDLLSSEELSEVKTISGSAGPVYLLHPFLFSPLFLNLDYLVRSFGRPVKGMIELVPGVKSLETALIESVLSGIAGTVPEGLIFRYRKQGKPSQNAEDFISGTLECAEGKIRFSHPDVLEKKHRSSAEWETVVLPEGGSLYYSLLDLKEALSENRESLIYSPDTADALRIKALYIMGRLERDM